MDVEEYPIAAELFIKALLEQRAMRLKGGIYHLTQIQMAYNSNRIEGSQLSQDQTRYLYETRTVLGDAPVDDVIETTNHFRAFDYMLDNIEEPLTTAKIKKYHYLLKTGTADADKDWFVVGGWKQVQNYVGNITPTAPEHVANEMEALVTGARGSMSFDQIVDFHHRFEAIHPFQDGNGRVGRLILFEQCLQNQVMPFVVLDSGKAYYYRGLDKYDDEPGFLRSTFRHFQDEYYQQFEQSVPQR
jgi:Fic family protein